jgi:hypothetical protein
MQKCLSSTVLVLVERTLPERESRGRLLCSLVVVDGFSCKSVFREEVPLILCCFALECRVYASEQVDTTNVKHARCSFTSICPKAKQCQGDSRLD